MKDRLMKTGSVFVVFLFLFTFLISIVYAADETDSAVSDVSAQLEAIDTLQEMQNKRSSSDSAEEYDEYVSKMFSARAAAKEAYDALTDAQKGQLDAELVSKLEASLDTVYYEPTLSVTPREDEYKFEVIFENRTMYEIGHHVSGEMPCTIILVDTAETGSSWTPDGLYECGKSNYEVTYCCDAVAPVVAGAHYKCLNLEDSGYYSKKVAEHIRAIVQNSYPYLTVEEMKSGLLAGGLSESFVSSLTRGDIISAVQMAIWAYSNADCEGMSEYVGTIEMTNNRIFKNPIHDYTNELWSWWDTGNSSPGIYDGDASYRVNTLVNYLCNLESVAAGEGQVVISDIQVTRAELLSASEHTYSIGFNVYINAAGRDGDELIITATSYSDNGDGTQTVTDKISRRVGNTTEYEFFVEAKEGDVVDVVLEGTQELEKGVYFYEPEGGKEVSQCLVAMSEGEVPVKTYRSFTFNSDIVKGLRIYKTDRDTGLPLSDITFSIYKTLFTEADMPDRAPTAEELELYVTEENKMGSVVTDETGYGALSLEDGIYLVVEEFNEEKIKEPVEPFYISVPMLQEVISETSDGTVTELAYTDIVSVYPKNDTVDTPEDEPPLPPVPDNVTGSFSILKYDIDDESELLEGAEFQVYRPATEEDTDTVIITCEGVEYAVVPVTVDGEPLILTTDENGSAVSPALTCGAYFIMETKAPAGYKLPDEAVSVTVSSDALEEAEVVYVSNQRGSLLPDTGGFGTDKIKLFGSIIVAAAIALLSARRIKRLCE